MPPSSVANDSGISSRDAEYPDAFAADIATGISSASAPTLFMKPDKKAPRRQSLTICPKGLRASAMTRSPTRRSEEHTSELQSLMRISYAVFCLKKKQKQTTNTQQQ